jgi:hypothetical protein
MCFIVENVNLDPICTTDMHHQICIIHAFIMSPGVNLLSSKPVRRYSPKVILECLLKLFSVLGFQRLPSYRSKSINLTTRQFMKVHEGNTKMLYQGNHYSYIQLQFFAVLNGHLILQAVVQLGCSV